MFNNHVSIEQTEAHERIEKIHREFEESIKESVCYTADFERNVIGYSNPQIEFMWQAWKVCNELKEAEIKKLRNLLFRAHGSLGHYLYTDDGERSCNTCMIDFNKMPAEVIESVMYNNNLRRMKREIAKAKELEKINESDDTNAKTKLP